MADSVGLSNALMLVCTVCRSVFLNTLGKFGDLWIVVIHTNVPVCMGTSVKLISHQRPGDKVVRVPGTRSRGPRFDSRWRQNSSHNCMALYCLEPFIITLPLCLYD